MGQKTIRRKKRTQNTALFWFPFVSLLVLQFLVWILVGGQLRMFRWLHGVVSLAPLWAFTLLDWGCAVCLGFFGGRICQATGVLGGARYSVGFYLVLAEMFGFFWHAIFFGTGIFLLALLSALCALVSLCGCTHMAYVQRVPFVWLPFVSFFWYLYRLIFTVFCLFSV